MTVEINGGVKILVDRRYAPKCVLLMEIVHVMVSLTTRDVLRVKPSKEFVSGYRMDMIGEIVGINHLQSKWPKQYMRHA
jgi:hypothetical protein